MLHGTQRLQWSPALTARVNFTLTAAYQYSILCVLFDLLFAFPFPVSAHLLGASECLTLMHVGSQE